MARHSAEHTTGYSSDEVILDTKLNQAFISECKKAHADVNAEFFNWTLINLRKAGKLSAKVTRRRKKRSHPSMSGNLDLVAEIAARKIQDKYRISSDRMMANPKYRDEFDRTVRGIDKTVDLYRARKRVFQLRKTRRLKPELITRIADWKRKVSEWTIVALRKDLSQVPDTPGIYIFRDKTGYLYVGEAADLRERLKTHLKDSDRKSLAAYLSGKSKTGGVSVEIHSFDRESRMKEVRVRRAYESELIRSRKPRFNVRN